MNPLHVEYSGPDKNNLRVDAIANRNNVAGENIFATEKGYEGYHKAVDNSSRRVSSLYFDRRPRAVRNQEADNLLKQTGGK